METMENPAQPTTSAPVPQRRFRWRPAAIVLLLAAGVLTAAWLAEGMDRNQRVLVTYITVLAGGLGLLIWFLRYSGSSGRARLAGLAMLVAAVALRPLVVRSDGFDGDMMPVWAWSWTPTPAQQFAASREAGFQAATIDAAAAPTVPAAETDFPGFLGKDRLGVVRDVKLATDWQARPPRELWRRPVGLGWSAFAVADGRAVTQEQREKLEAVVCYDLLSGEELWAHQDAAHFQEALGGNGPRATPTIENGRVYALGASGLLNCLNLSDGDRAWHVDILRDRDGAGVIPNLAWGMAGSPLLEDGKVIVNPGGDQGRSLAAYDAESGRLAWSAGDRPAGYASPAITTLAGKRQVLMFDGLGLSAYDPADGAPLWSFPWTTQQMVHCTQPLHLADFGMPEQQDQVLISSGYGTGSALLKIVRQEGSWTAQELWTSKQLKSKMSSVVLKDGYAYGLDEGILTCIDLATGERTWKDGRYQHGQLLLVGELLLVQAQSGDVALVRATPEAHQELAYWPMLSDKTWNNPALAGNLLLVRNDREAACYELPLAP